MSRMTRVCPLTILTICLLLMASAVEPSDAVDIARTHVETISEEFVGLSISVAVNGEVVWSKGFGFAEIGERVPVTPATRFLVFSASKAWTATAAAVLLEKGKLRIDHSVNELVDTFPDKGHPITVYQLATHAGGIRHYKNDEEALNPGHCRDVASALPIFAEDPLDFTPGERQGYSSWGYVLLSAAIESASGEPFDEYLKRVVLEPAGMESTVHAASMLAGEIVALPYRRMEDEVSRIEDLDASCKWGAGGYLSTPDDLVRFYLAMLDGRLVSPRSREMVMRPDEDGITRFGGRSEGGRSQIHVDATHEVIVAIATNERGDGVDLRTFTEMIANLFIEKKRYPNG